MNRSVHNLRLQGPLYDTVGKIFRAKFSQISLGVCFCILHRCADTVSLAFMACTFGHFFPGPGFIAWKFLPIAAVVSLAILLLPMPRVWRGLGGNRWRRIWYVVGVVTIPFLQLLTAEVFPLVREPLCDRLVGLGFGC